MKKTFILIAVSMFLITSCGKQKERSHNQTSITTSTSKNSADATVSKTQLISEPVAEAKKAPYKYSIDPTKENVLRTETGSKIIIPKDAFVDVDGNLIKGQVDIEFEEFHDASDIILSGIPMNIMTDSDEEASFESAGMFRIEGTQKGKEIRLAEHKTMEIQIASNQVGDDFNFYEFDEVAGNWIEKAQSVKAVANEDRIVALKELGPDPVQPFEIKKASSNDLVFDINVDKGINPEFAVLDNVMWRSIEQTVDNELFDGAIRKPNLECIDQAQSIFRLTGSAASGKAINTRVQPVLFGSNWKKANTSFQSKMKKYHEAIADRKKDKERVNKMGEQMRNFSLAKFGVYNFDRIYHLKRKVQFYALFFVPALQKVFKQGFLIQGKEKVAIPYTTTSGYKFTFDPTKSNTVITIDDNGYIYEFTADQFASISETYPSEETYTFQMKATSFQIKEPSDLSDYLASL